MMNTCRREVAGDDMQEWLSSANGFYLLLLIVGIVLLVAASRIFTYRREHEWSRAARHLGLRFFHNEQGPCLQGKLGGRAVSLRVAEESSDSGGGVIVALAVVAVSDLPATMHAEAVPGMIGDLTNLTEERFLTGDQEFDQNVRVQGQDESALRRYWTESRREIFLQLVHEQKYDRLELEDARLCAELRTVVSDHKQVEKLLLRMLKTSQGLDAGIAIEAT